MLEIKKMLISYNYTKGVTITPRYIVVHDTDNTDKGANAYAHYRYFGGGDRGASAHYFVDDSNIIQILEDTWKGWHCGDSYSGVTPTRPEVNNGNSIAIETCVNRDGDYEKALKNTIDLVKYLIKKWNIKINDVVRHNDVTGKYCPRRIMDSGNWDWFKRQLLMEMGNSSEESPNSMDSNVLSIQRLCNSLGISDMNGKRLIEDGIIGPKTKYAVSHLPYCGIPYVQRQATKWIQRKLSIMEDGIFYTATERAVKLWQRNHGLQEDGIVGPNTWVSFLY